MSDTNYQSRKFLLTINNPQDCGMTHDVIIDRAQLFNPDYFCLADEIGASGTYHTHIYLFSHSPMRFSTVKKRFPTAHIDSAKGSSKSNRDYIRKEGKWAGTDKEETKVEGTFQEFGTLPSESDEKSPKMALLIHDVKDGLTNVEIIEKDPSFAFRGREIDLLRQQLMDEQYCAVNRDVVVHYIYGDSGTGKTRGIYARHPASDICRITDYGGRNGVRFDSYHGQSVLVFEEFHSQIPIASMLNYLDIYPQNLPARYNDKVACYTTVYITSNIPLEEQYMDIQRSQLETWRAFLRRIDTVTEYRRGGVIREVHHEKI